MGSCFRATDRKSEINTCRFVDKKKNIGKHQTVEVTTHHVCLSLSTAHLSPVSISYLSPVSCLSLRSELSDHVDSIDTGLENLQNILNTQTFTFDASPLVEVSLRQLRKKHVNMLTTYKHVNSTSTCVKHAVLTEHVYIMLTPLFSFSVRPVRLETLTSTVWTP